MSGVSCGIDSLAITMQTFVTCGLQLSQLWLNSVSFSTAPYNIEYNSASSSHAKHKLDEHMQHRHIWLTLLPLNAYQMLGCFVKVIVCP